MNLKNLNFVIGFSVASIIIVCVAFFTIISTYNEGVKLEQTLKAQYTQNQNNYDNYFKKLKEVCQVPEMLADDLERVYASTLKGRYGNDGSQAVFQFIKEHNPNIDSTLYKQIQQVIEAGRNDFETNQKMLIDKKRVYELFLNEFPSGPIASVMGFPNIDLNQYTIITSDETDNAFKTKKTDPIKLR